MVSSVQTGADSSVKDIESLTPVVHVVPNDDEDIINDDADHDVLSDMAVTVHDEVVWSEAKMTEAAVSELNLSDEQTSALIAALKRPLTDIE